jgi:23S rRNA pseudouridine1911/1915/1917 synthase
MANLSIQPNDYITYKIYHEDSQVLVVNKPSGIVSTPGKGHDRNSLMNGLFAKYGTRLQNLGKDREFGLLHRLDRTTSGLLMVALTPSAYDALRADFAARKIAKFYWAITKGVPKEPKGLIKRSILEYKGETGGDDRTKKIARVSQSGKPALTAYRVIATNNLASLIECRAVTGRLHQIRVHLDSIGCPILGDEMYGPTSIRDAAPRLALHAHRLMFKHPASGSTIDVHSPWPPDLRNLLSQTSLPRPDLLPKAQPTDQSTTQAQDSDPTDLGVEEESIVDELPLEQPEDNEDGGDDME